MLKKLYKPHDDGTVEEMDLKDGNYVPNGRIFKKWDGPSAEVYQDVEAYSGIDPVKDAGLPEPPAKDKRIVCYSPDDFVPHWYVLVE